MIDENLKTEWFDELDKIKEIKVRASCQGHNTERVSYIVFRFSDKKNDNKAKELVKILNEQDGIYSKSDIGTEGRNRICAAGKTWYSQNSWKQWWSTLAEKIKESIKKVLKEN